MPSVSDVAISRDCSLGIVAVWIVSCLKHSSIDHYCLVDIANKIAPGGSGIDSSRYCSCVDSVLFETLINKLLFSGCNSKQDRTQCSGVDCSLDCSGVNRVLFETLINRSLLSG